MELVLTETKERLGFITLNRPEKRNALSTALIDQLKQAIQRMESDAEVQIVILRSADKPFCAGADLAYLQQIRNNSVEENIQDSQHLRGLFDAIYKSKKVFISQVEGPALAGGCGLATICDYCFATPDATFGYTESRIGFIPALVMVYLRNRVQGHLLRKWLLSGAVFSAEEALSGGLIDRIVAEGIDAVVEQFALTLAKETSSSSRSLIKQMLAEIPGMTLDEALDYAAKMNATARASADCIKGIDAFLNKERLSW